MTPPKETKLPKPPTKGDNQIIEDNAVTLEFYRNMGILSFTVHLIVRLVFFYEDITYISIACFFVSTVINVACYQLMYCVSWPTHDDRGTILDSGADLNIEGGYAEFVKDLIILTSITQVAAVFTNYCWYILPAGSITLVAHNGGFFFDHWTRNVCEIVKTGNDYFYFLFSKFICLLSLILTC